MGWLDSNKKLEDRIQLLEERLYNLERQVSNQNGMMIRLAESDVTIIKQMTGLIDVLQGK